MTNDAHSNEYLAAIAGMADHTMPPASQPAPGDFVSGKTGGRRWSGRVEAIDSDRMTIDVGGAWITANVADITH